MSDKNLNDLERVALQSSALPGLSSQEPSLEDLIRLAIERYGSDAVRTTVKALTKSRPGRPKLHDWLELRQVVEADARDWLEGRDPFSLRSNYSIAKEYAEKHPGWNAISTYKRIERKLGERPYGRAWFMLVRAMLGSRDKWPYAIHLKALQELLAIDPNPNFQTLLRVAQSNISAYETKSGQAPPPALTMREIREGARNALAKRSPQPGANRSES
jgi:hypothetical protein